MHNFFLKIEQKTNSKRIVYSWKGCKIKITFHIARRNIRFKCYKSRLSLLWYEHWLLLGTAWILYSFSATCCVVSGYLYLLKICLESSVFIFVCLSILTLVFRFFLSWDLQLCHIIVLNSENYIDLIWRKKAATFKNYSHKTKVVNYI